MSKPIDRTIIVTKELIDLIQSPRGGWNKEQLYILGVDWPPPPKWQKHVIGQRRISSEEEEMLIALRGSIQVAATGEFRPRLVELPVANLRDIPAMLRVVADEIERGEHGDVKTMAAVLFRQDLSLSAFGWGDCNLLEVVGAFQRATLLDEGGFRINGGGS